MKRRHSVSFRVDLLILLAVVVIAGILIASAYFTNAREVDSFYMEKSSQTAKTLGSFLDGDRLEAIAGLLRTEDYQALRQEAAGKEDDTAIRQYLEEHGQLDYILRLLNVLSAGRDLCLSAGHAGRPESQHVSRRSG